MSFPHYIQEAVRLGLLVEEGGQIVDCKKDEVETVLGTARIVEKLQPTTTAEVENTTDQEAIVLCRILNSPHGTARELWSQLRVGFGVAHDQAIPLNLWSTSEFKAVGNEIDRTYLNQRDNQVISREGLIGSYVALQPASQLVDPISFNQVVGNLGHEEAMAAYGDAGSEWEVALDLLRKARVKALYQEMLQEVAQVQRADTKLEKQIEFQQGRLMECLGLLQGSLGNQGNAVDAVEDLLAPQNGGVSIIDQIMNARTKAAPVSTGIQAMDLDMEGGVRPAGQETGGRLFTLAARTGIGKTVLGVHAFVNLAMGGLTVGFISAELDRAAIYARIWANATKVAYLSKKNAPMADAGDLMRNCVTVGSIESPDKDREKHAMLISEAAMLVQAAGGKMLIEDPWGANVDEVINSLRSMKAKNPELRAAVVDHFHVLGRHKGAPASEAAMLEERAYKLMTCAKELGIDLIVLAQMNRVGMDMLGKKQPPGLDQIRGTDALSHVSHAVWIVRKEMEAVDGKDEWTKRLEFHHAKTRGRQAYWDTSKEAMTGINGNLGCSILEMDYSFSSVRSDNTLSQIQQTGGSL
jgi:replicative DNA helicase